MGAALTFSSFGVILRNSDGGQWWNVTINSGCALDWMTRSDPVVVHVISLLLRVFGLREGQWLVHLSPSTFRSVVVCALNSQVGDKGESVSVFFAIRAQLAFLCCFCVAWRVCRPLTRWYRGLLRSPINLSRMSH